MEVLSKSYGSFKAVINSFKAGATAGKNQWNGNISGMKWKTKGPLIVYSAKNLSAYAFEYDKLNRLKLANYGSGR